MAATVFATMSPTASVLGGLTRLPAAHGREFGGFVSAMPSISYRRGLQVRPDVRDGIDTVKEKVDQATKKDIT